MLTEEQRALLEKHGERIKARIRKFKFIPPLQYEEATSYVFEKLCSQITKCNSLDIFEKYLNRSVSLSVRNYYKKAQHIPIEINENRSIETNTLEDDYWQDRKEYAIASSINELDCKDRNIILLYYYDGKKEREIARLLGLSQQAISKQLHKALDKLKPKIAERLAELERVREEL